MDSLEDRMGYFEDKTKKFLEDIQMQDNDETDQFLENSGKKGKRTKTGPKQIVQRILILLLSLVTSSESLCPCSVAQTSHVINSAGRIVTSCDGACPSNCYKLQIMMYEYLATLHEIYKCFECDCPWGITFTREYLATGTDRILWYSCIGVCTNPAYTCSATQVATIPTDAVGGQQGIFRCKACPLNCDVCTSPTVCTGCSTNSGYYMGPAGVCQTCQQLFGSGCNTCDGTVCLTCYYPEVLDYSTGNKTCIPCTSVTNCVNCMNGPICGGCQSNYYLDYSKRTFSFIHAANHECVQCGVNCAVCSDGPLCAFCDSGNFFLNISDGMLFTYQGNKSCSPCHVNCLSCGPGPKCNTCNPNFHIDFASANYTCLPCSSITNCNTCTHGLKCTTCFSPYVLDIASLNTSCTACNFSNCQTCADGPICNACNSGSVMVLPANMSCAPCNSMPNCQSCADGPICTVCNSGSAMVLPANMSCAPCNSMPNCQSCADGPICTACITGCFLVFATCNFSFIKVNISCVTCSFANCATCADGPVCTQCVTNHILDSTFTVCTACPVRQYSFNNICYSCISNCTHCQASGTNVICNQCDANFVVHADTFSCVDCKSVTSKCLECSDMFTCTKCEYPHVISSTGQCDECENGFDYLDDSCVKPSGCVSFLPGYTKCLACSTTHHFVYSSFNNLCVCETGYRIIDTGKTKVCLAQCGDGITSFPDEDCDDGNTRSSDGCDQTCKQESGFTCPPSSPTQCILTYNPESFGYNYAFKYEETNRGRFSFSLYPQHESFKYVQWTNYLSLNISLDFIVPNTLSCKYLSETNEILVEFDYMQTLQDLIVEAKLSFQNTAVAESFSVVQSSAIATDQVKQIKKISQTFSALPPKISANPSELSLIINLQGKNAALIVQSQTVIEAQKAASTMSLAVTIVIMVQFFIGTFFHKMIGLETVQVLQFAFFARMMFNQENTFILNALNPLKYSAYGGYTNYELFYGSETDEIESSSNQEVGEEFLSVGLMKYFTLNVNLTLILPAVVLLIYAILLVMEIKKRSNFMQSFLQYDKDKYTDAKRRCQRVYDNAVFPFVNVLNMAALFCTILYLQSEQVQEPTNLESIIEKSSFIIHVIILFTTFLMYTFEGLTSYSELMESRLTEEERDRIPLTTIQKLQHDKNYPYRPNYKPGYVLIYLAYFLILELIIIFDVLIPEFNDFGVEILILLSFVYLVFIWVWQPYCLQANFHNKVLIFNHLVVFLFSLVCEIFNRMTLILPVLMSLVYVSIFLIVVVGILGYIRIYVEFKFREKLLEDPTVAMQFKSSNPKSLNIQYRQLKTNNSNSKERKEKLFIKNQFLYENQLKELDDKIDQEENKNAQIIAQNDLSFIKQKMRRQLSGQNTLADYLENPDLIFEGKIQQNNRNGEGFLGLNERLMEKLKLKKEKQDIGRKRISDRLKKTKQIQ